MRSIAHRAHAREIEHHEGALSQRERDYPNALALLPEVNALYILAGETRGWEHSTTQELDALARDLNGLLDYSAPDVDEETAHVLLRWSRSMRALLVECERRRAGRGL